MDRRNSLANLSPSNRKLSPSNRKLSPSNRRGPAPRKGPRVDPRSAVDELGVAGDLGAQAHYADPAYYDKTYRSRQADVEYYLNLARGRGGPVLEYGVGTGRIALPLARAGISVTGVDLSRPMLSQLRTLLAHEPAEVARRVSIRRGDMRSLRLKTKFPLVLAPFNAILHLYTRKDIERFLARVRAHLEPGGWLVFDFLMPKPADLCLDPERSYGAGRIRDPTTGLLVKYSERFEYDQLRQMSLCWMQFQPVEDGEPDWVVPLTQRQFFPREMEALLHYNGFEDQRWFGGFAGEALTSDADSIVIWARPKKRRR